MEESENKETEKKEKSLNAPVIAGLIVVAITAVIALIPVYYRYTFDSVINKGNYKEINKLINEQDFIEYASKEQGQRALEFVATNIASSSLNEKYDLMEKTAFKKFENEVVGKLVVASMTEFVTKSPIEERLKFLKNHNVVFYLNDNQRKAVVSSFVGYPITDIDSSSLNKLFFEVCNEKEVENICNSIKQNHNDLPKNFVDSLITAVLNNSSSKKAYYLKDLLNNYESSKGYILLYANETAKKNIDNNSEFVRKMENIFKSFPECFNSEVKNNFENMKKGLETLNNAEITVNKDRVDSELRRLREKRNWIPESEYISGFVKELVFDGSHMFPPSNAYLVTVYGENYLLITTLTKFATTGHFNMYVSVSSTKDLGKDLKDICYIYGIRSVLSEVSSDLRRERERLTKEINDIERNSEEVYRKVSELKDMLEDCKKKILFFLNVEANNNSITGENQDIDLFVKSLDFEMVKCPADSFIMGSPEDEKGRNEEEILHKESISKFFFIGKYEVTQSLYEKIMGNNPSYFKGDDRPVESISYEEAKAFCNKLNDVFSNSLPKGYNFDLPTEEQWEYACRAGTNTALNNSKNLTTSDETCPNLDEVAWYDKNSEGETHSVGQKKPNAWGIYDMHGNVWEWCRNWYWYGVYSNIDKQISGVDPIPERVVRGGAWYFNACFCRSACRGDGNYRAQYNFLGFRVALVPSEEKIESNIKDNSLFEIEEIGLEMIKCPAGSFMMGSPRDEYIVISIASEKKGHKNKFGFGYNEKLHHVTLTKPFYIGRYEVTQEQYSALMGKNPSKFVGANNPVESVSYNDAKDFCDKLNLKYLKILPQGYKFDLPTESQWEYACRTGTTTSLNSGENITSEKDSCKNLDKLGWYGNNSDKKTHPVGQKKPNAWGIYDMHGNVCEWCRDWYGEYPEKYVKDPIGANSGSRRVFRGGCWDDWPLFCRSAFRLYTSPSNCSYDLGFRVALVPIE